jgi:hypothetical protein
MKSAHLEVLAKDLDRKYQKIDQSSQTEYDGIFIGRMNDGNLQMKKYT